MSEAFAGKKPEQAGFAGMPIEQTPSSLRWSLVDHVSKQDAELGRLRAELKESRRLFARETDEYIKWMDEAQAENEKLRAALKPFAAILFHAEGEDPSTGQLYGWVYEAEVRAAAAALKETN